MKNKKEITCHKCKHKWDTNSTLALVTCSCCGVKVKNPNYHKGKDEDTS